MSEGWIKIHRQIQSHWIWTSDHRFKWWIDILLTVNHKPSKVLIKGQIIECGRGQSVMSLDTWAKRWNVSKKAVRDFFILLQDESMLSIENIKITTRITVTKYDDYQNEVNAEETQRKRRGNAEETQRLHKQECKEGKNEKNIKNVIPPTPEMVIDYCKERGNKIDPQTFIDWNEARGWMLNGRKMKDWQAAIRTWEQRNNNHKHENNTGGTQRSAKRTNSYWPEQGSVSSI